MNIVPQLYSIEVATVQLPRQIHCTPAYGEPEILVLWDIVAIIHWRAHVAYDAVHRRYTETGVRHLSAAIVLRHDGRGVDFLQVD